MSKTGMT